ncbi:hypothetical protein TrVGV298_007088 [Trichoderma virens]|nr:hypothetical protein TrVGV298_007088 [Trichoderma virens]
MRITRLTFTAAHLLIPAAASGSTFNCQPGQSCWPTISEWQAFNRSVSGSLRVTVPIGSVCFPSSPNFDDDACATVKANYMNGTFRESSNGALQNTEWEACGSANCYPGVFAPQGQTCSLGRLSPLQVNVQNSQDITTTLAFVRKYGIRMVVKNTGHDFLGRSSAANTLLLSTHNLKNMAFKSSFTLKNCPAASSKHNIGIIGAGVIAEEAVDFFDQHNMMVTIGGCSTVGIAGGFGQGAGHGPLTPTYGLMVDQAVEFDVVTADGVFRTINECNDPDLFWAMRGGGGQSYAILVNYKFQLYPETQWAVWRLEATFNDTDPDYTKSTVLRDVLTELAKEQTNWSKHHVASYRSVSAASFRFLEVLPVGQDPLGTIKQLTSKYNTFLTGHAGLNITVNGYFLYNSEKGFYTGQADYLAAAGIVGISALTPSRLITTDNFETLAKVDALVSGVLLGMETARQELGGALGTTFTAVILATGASNTPDAQNATSANPAWRNTLWHFIAAAGWSPGSPDATGDQAVAAARAALGEIKKPLTVQASYMNEADPGEVDWQNLFFGENYDKLLAIKQKYDPDTLLNCKGCVGYLGDEDPMYSCYSDNPVPSTPYPFN